MSDKAYSRFIKTNQDRVIYERIFSIMTDCNFFQSYTRVSLHAHVMCAFDNIEYSKILSLCVWYQC